MVDRRIVSYDGVGETDLHQTAQLRQGIVGYADSWSTQLGNDLPVRGNEDALARAYPPDVFAEMVLELANGNNRHLRNVASCSHKVNPDRRMTTMNEITASFFSDDHSNSELAV